MFGKKMTMHVVGFFLFGVTFEMHSFWSAKTDSAKKDSVLEMVEKPSFFQQGDYKDGRYVQFSLDRTAFVWGSLAGVTARTLIALAQCGTKIESFKSSVLRPGVIKSMLFWGPAIAGYRYALAVKTNDQLRQRLANYSENMTKQFSPDGQKL